MFNWCKCQCCVVAKAKSNLIVVNFATGEKISRYTFNLSVVLCYKASLVSLNWSICFVFNLIHPLTSNRHLVMWQHYQIPSVVGLECFYLSLYRNKPFRMFTCFLIILRFNIRRNSHYKIQLFVKQRIIDGLTIPIRQFKLQVQ